MNRIDTTYHQELIEHEREQRAKNHLAKIGVKAHNCIVRHAATLDGASWRDSWRRELERRGMNPSGTTSKKSDI